MIRYADTLASRDLLDALKNRFGVISLDLKDNEAVRVSASAEGEDVEFEEKGECVVLIVPKVTLQFM